MEYIRHTTEFHISEDTVVSLGKFDGIHRGHGHLMEYLKDKKKSGLKTVIFTFDVPPQQKIGGWEESKVLTTNDEKMQLFEQYGIDYLLECPFTEEIRQMDPEYFIRWIVERLHVKSFVAGRDFRFGYQRKGDYLLLKKLANRYGYEAEVVEKVREGLREISSTWIREEILAGRLQTANHLLGYHYFLQGNVVHGREIGRTLDVPTANLLVPKEKLIPPFGVYVTRTSIEKKPGQVYGGITNLGCKPTIAGENPLGAETHLFGFGESVYGMQIKVEFLKWVRPERKFHSLKKLKNQMHRDIISGINYYTNITDIC